MWTRLSSVPLLTALAACATPAPPPTLPLQNFTCANAPNLAGARPLALPNNRAVTVTIDANTPCLETPAGKQLHVLFSLPQLPAEYLLSVVSAPHGTGIFSLDVSILDSAGMLLRALPRDAVVFRGNSLSAGARIRPGDRYLVVSSDPGNVGQSVTWISDVAQITTVSTGTAFVPVGTGTSTTSTYTYSHTGTITVSLQEMPK